MNKANVKENNMNINQRRALEILTKTDGYKLEHASQYPDKTELVFSSLTTRQSNHSYIKDDIYVFGLEYIKNKLISEWDVFFALSEIELKEVLSFFNNFAKKYHQLDNFDIDRFYRLWKHQQLPLKIQVLKDHLIVPFKIPLVTIYNTNPDFYWVTNYIESYLLTTVWPIITSATISYHMKQLFKKYLIKTSDNLNFLNQQGTDFSYRGMSGNTSGILSGLGHLANFDSSSTLQAVLEYQHFWNDKQITSAPATEHSVMTSYGKKNEAFSYEHIIDKYPKGILSMVSDSWNLWNVIDNILPNLKTKIYARDGKLVVRPDSGNPLHIVCGDPNAIDPAAKSGVLRLLEKHFGSTINSKGYKVLNPKIGLIYGDSITFETVASLLKAITDLGFSTENIVFGMGATLYQSNNRDTFGFVFKTSYVQIDQVGFSIQKNPITSKVKKSFKGLVGVFKNEKHFIAKDSLSWKEFNSDDNYLK